MTVRVTGLKPFMKDIVRMRDNTSNMTPAFKRAVVLYHKWVVKNINASGALHENTALRWKRLATSTAQEKARLGFSPKPLIRTGDLRRDWELTASSKYGRIRSAHFYSGIHEEGNKEGKPPKRKIFPTVQQGKKIVAPAFQEHLYKGVKGVKKTK